MLTFVKNVYIDGMNCIYFVFIYLRSKHLRSKMIAANLSYLLQAIAQRNAKNGFLMDITQTIQRMQDAASNALNLLRNQQDIENQQIEVKLDGLDPKTSDYQKQYQELMTEQQKLVQEQSRETQRLQEEWNRKERPYETLKEQVETELEVINADIDGVRNITKENASAEFSMLQGS